MKKKNLSDTIGFKTKITLVSKKVNIKIFYENLEQYNFLINKLKKLNFLYFYFFLIF